MVIHSRETETTRRKVLASGALLVLNGCSFNDEYETGDLRILNSSDEDYTITVTVADPEGEIILNDIFEAEKFQERHLDTEIEDIFVGRSDDQFEVAVNVYDYNKTYEFTYEMTCIGNGLKDSLSIVLRQSGEVEFSDATCYGSI